MDHLVLIFMGILAILTYYLGSYVGYRRGVDHGQKLASLTCAFTESKRFSEEEIPTKPES
jgi:hypothetical protein